MSEIKLKPCPFCGGDNVGIWENKPITKIIPTTYEARCYDCHFGLSPSKTKEEAIVAWNTRKPVERVLERLTSRLTAYKMYSELNFPKGDIVVKEIDKIREIIKEEVG